MDVDLAQIDGGRQADGTAGPRPDPQERLYVVGDVHGRYDLLARLLAAIVADAETLDDGRRARLVFLGDYVDRGDQSRAVLDLLGALRADDPGGRLVFLRGNHEAALLAFLDDPVGRPGWLDHGGRQTAASYGVRLREAAPGPAALTAARDALADALGPALAFLRATRIGFASGGVVCAHAGWDAAFGPDDQPEPVALWGRPPRRPAAEAGLLLVHGHVDAPAPVDGALRICVDTGAYYSGRLTAVRLDAGRRFIATG